MVREWSVLPFASCASTVFHESTMSRLAKIRYQQEFTGVAEAVLPFVVVPTTLVTSGSLTMPSTTMQYIVLWLTLFVGKPTELRGADGTLGVGVGLGNAC